jgi:hypothetical protein
MKHSYRADCDCTRCTNERTRRSGQAHADTARRSWPAVRYRGRRASVTRRPTPGSQEWAETRGDDIDSESGDY